AAAGSPVSSDDQTGEYSGTMRNTVQNPEKPRAAKNTASSAYPIACAQSGTDLGAAADCGAVMLPSNQYEGPARLLPKDEAPSSSSPIRITARDANLDGMDFLTGIPLPAGLTLLALLDGLS